MQTFIHFLQRHFLLLYSIFVIGIFGTLGRIFFLQFIHPVYPVQPHVFQGNFTRTGTIGSPENLVDVQGSLIGYYLGSGNYTLTADGTGTLLGGPFSFSGVQIIYTHNTTFLHYGDIHYKSLSQSGLSALLHQYFWLGDRYENKRYKFTQEERDLFTQRLGKEFIKYEMDDNLGYFTSIRNIYGEYKNPHGSVIGSWTGNLSLKNLGDFYREMPSSSLDGTIFLDAFLGTGFIDDN